MKDGLPRTEAPLPWQGLLEVLSSYTGKGQLYSAVAAAPGPDEWSPDDVRRRARRHLFEECIPLLGQLPATAAAWLEALPAEVLTARAISAAPLGRVDWPRTRLHGWPPVGGFIGRDRRRVADRNLTEVLCWTADRLDRVRVDACTLAPQLDAGVRRQIGALLDARSLLPSEGDVQPDRAVLAAASQGGVPWSALARLADALRGEDRDLEQLARRMLLPDPAVRGRLFQLGCLGVVLLALRSAGCVVTGLRPLGLGSGPSHRAVDRHGKAWDVWFEAAGAWTYYGWSSPYRRLTSRLPSPWQPVGADLAVVLPGRVALAVECKYTDDLNYVVRDGYHQGMTYLAELAEVNDVAAVAVVGPDGVVPLHSETSTMLGSASLMPSEALGGWIAAAVSHALERASDTKGAR